MNTEREEIESKMCCHLFQDMTATGEKAGVPNDSFLSNPLKRHFRLSGVLLKLCRFISGRAIMFLSVQSL